MIDPRTPVLIGGGQITQRTAQQKNLAASLDPIGLIAEAARAAARDTTLGDRLWPLLDTIAVVRFTADSTEGGRLPGNLFANPPRSVGKALGARARRQVYTSTGGDSPQKLVNATAAQIASGEVEVALLGGSEALATMMDAFRTGHALNWGDDPGGLPETPGPGMPGTSQPEQAHGLFYPVNTYPLFENAWRGAKKRSVEEHQAALGRLFAPFTRVAARNPHAWFPVARSAEEIATPSDANRFVGFPYTKYMNAVIAVDQAAAVIMTSVGKARELGVPEDRFVYMHGCSEGIDTWNVTARANLGSSPAIRLMARKAFAMAGWTQLDLDYIDLYSCFPSAVEIACDEIGLDTDDPRGLTVTGGLPYFGGPGNNYAMHAIVTMLGKLRAKPGSKGLVTANGWYLTKHACGLYSTQPVAGAWTREDPAILQAELDRWQTVPVAAEPSGAATVETYTVVHDRKAPMMGIVIGRLTDGRRFVANTPNDPATLSDMIEKDPLGRPGVVTSAQGRNTFVPGA